MRIAICDDDYEEITRIASIIEAYKHEKAAPIAFATFQSATELLSAVKTAGFTLYILDIMMPGLNGIDAAKEIRAMDKDVKLLFLTSSPEFALESYDVRAYHYLLKPAARERLFPILDALLLEEQTPQEGITLKTQTGIFRVLFAQLAFVEVKNKKLFFHLNDGEVRVVNAPLADFEDVLLSRSEFVKTHRAYIVNLWQIKEFTAAGLLTYTRETVPLSRLLYPAVRKAYMEHLFVEKGLA